MITKFTPGPWRVFGLPQHGGKFSVAAGDNGRNCIAVVTKRRNGTSYTDSMEIEEGFANASLIAAAPEMYEALQAVKKFTRSGEEADWTAVEILVNNALFKAHGGQQ